MISRPIEIRFWEKVEKASKDDCWFWTGFRDPNGYGRLSIKNTPKLAHRISWELSKGALDESKCVLHRCDNPSCVNPDHLFIGTQTDNLKDMTYKGRRKGGAAFGDSNGMRKYKGLLSGEKNGCAKLTWDQVDEIRSLYIPNRMGCQRLAKRFSVSKSTIKRIINRSHWVQK